MSLAADAHESIRHALASGDWPWTSSGSLVVVRELFNAYEAAEAEVDRLREGLAASVSVIERSSYDDLTISELNRHAAGHPYHNGPCRVCVRDERKAVLSRARQLLGETD